MNRERKLNDASEIAKTKEPVFGPFKNETNGAMLYVPVPTIHQSWDEIDHNVCQGPRRKYQHQGKFLKN